YIGDLNVGRQTEYVQDLNLNFNPSYFPRVMNLSASVSARYTDLVRKYMENLPEGGQEERFQSDGNVSRGIRTNLSLMNSSMLSQLSQKLKSRHGSKDDRMPHDDKIGF